MAKASATAECRLYTQPPTTLQEGPWGLACDAIHSASSGEGRSTHRTLLPSDVLEQKDIILDVVPRYDFVPTVRRIGQLSPLILAEFAKG